jgi:hypothetical protein
MAADNLKKLSGVPPKAPGSKALARWLTVRIAEISNLANPRPNLANACSPWALCGSYLWEKIFCEPELKEKDLSEESEEFEIPNCEPFGDELPEMEGFEDTIICYEPPEEPEEHECEDDCPGCPSRCGKEPEEEDHD